MTCHAESSAESEALAMTVGLTIRRGAAWPQANND